MDNHSIIAFFWGSMLFYVVFFAALLGLAALLSGRMLCLDGVQQGERRLGRSIWLCAECHALYTSATYQCPRGHATQLIAEAEALLAESSAYATEPMVAVPGSAN